MKARLLFAMLALLLTIGAQAQIATPPPAPEPGFLRLCGFTGQIALRDYPGANGNVLWYMKPGDSPVPKPELEYDQNGIEWRRMTFGALDGWVRTRKANGTDIALCLGS